MKQLIIILFILPLFVSCSSDEDGENGGSEYVNILKNTVWKDIKDTGIAYLKFTDDKYCIYEWYNSYDQDATSFDKYKYRYNNEEKSVTILSNTNGIITIGNINDNTITLELKKTDYIFIKQ